MFAYKHLLPSPVFECDGHWFLRVDDARAVLLRHMGGAPIKGFSAGWLATFVYSGFDCVYLLDLERQGLHVTWLVSPDGRRLGDRLADLQRDQRMLLREAVLSRGLARAGGLAGDGLQLVETALLRDILGLAAEGEAGPGPLPVAASQESLRMLGAPHGMQTHLRFRPGDETLDLHEGWATDATGPCLAIGTSSAARSGLVPQASRYLLTMTLFPVTCGNASIELLVNGSPAGTVRLDPQWQGEGADLAFWLPPERIGGRPLEIMFRHEQDFRLGALRLEYGRSLAGAAPDAPAPDAAALMARFENIGDNCEFGLVQRHYQADPVGLLRFAGLRTPRRLIRFLDDDFGALGERGSLGVTVIGGEYWIVDHVYGMAYHTFRYQHEAAAEDVIRENETKARYLRRKFIEDLQDGEKILVYKRVVTQDAHEIVALHAALNRLGTINKLLWVTEATDGRLPGDVEWVGDRLLRGYVRTISLTDAHDFDPEVWLLLCRNAALVFDAAGRG